MNKLNYEQMENFQGGGYCQMICYWILGGGGYQGSWDDLFWAYYNHCFGQCGGETNL